MDLLLLILGIVLCGLALVILYINKQREQEGKEPIKKSVGLTCAILAVILCVTSQTFIIIPTGYTGVRTTFGQIDDTTVQNGFNWKVPYIQLIEKVNNKQQDIVFNDKIWSETSTRTAIFYEDITVTYQINPEKSAWIYANVSDYKKQLVSQAIVTSAIKSSSKGLSDVDATNRSIIEPLAAENIQKAFNDKYGTDAILINKVSINNADFEDSYNEAVSARQNAQLESEKQAIENQKKIDKAEADAKVTKTEAEAKAEAKLITARAESEANKLLEKSLTSQILQEKYINKWDGKLPTVVADESSMLMIPSGK